MTTDRAIVHPTVTGRVERHHFDLVTMPLVCSGQLLDPLDRAAASRIDGTDCVKNAVTHGKARSENRESGKLENRETNSAIQKG